MLRLYKPEPLEASLRGDSLSVKVLVCLVCILVFYLLVSNAPRTALGSRPYEPKEDP